MGVGVSVGRIEISSGVSETAIGVAAADEDIGTDAVIVGTPSVYVDDGSSTTVSVVAVLDRVVHVSVEEGL